MFFENLKICQNDIFPTLIFFSYQRRKDFDDTRNIEIQSRGTPRIHYLYRGGEGLIAFRNKMTPIVYRKPSTDLSRVTIRQAYKIPLIATDIQAPTETIITKIEEYDSCSCELLYTPVSRSNINKIRTSMTMSTKKTQEK